MPSNAKASPAGDGVELRADGTVAVEWDDVSVTLRRPKVREWGSYMEAMAAADEWLEQNKPLSPVKVASADNPYRPIYVQIIDELGNLAAPVDVDSLPLWMCDGKLLSQLNTHWLALPLRRSGETPTGTASR